MKCKIKNGLCKHKRHPTPRPQKPSHQHLRGGITSRMRCGHVPHRDILITQAIGRTIDNWSTQKEQGSMKTKIGKLKFFLVLGTAQFIFACIVFLNELDAINHRFPGGSFPIEHEFSWARVFLFGGVAMSSLLAIWVFTARKELSIFLPSIKAVEFPAVVITLSSLLFSYESWAGWCCGAAMESIRYFGFPFSFIRADSLVEVFSNFDLPQILSYQFFLDLLFWSNAVFILLSSMSLLFQKGKFAHQGKEHGFSKSG